MEKNLNNPSNQDVILIERLPSPILQAFVQRYVIFEMNQPLPTDLKSPALGSCMLTYVYKGRDAFIIDKSGKKTIQAHQLGIGGQTISIDPHLKKGVTFGMIAVNFTPIGMSKLLNLKSAEFTDDIVGFEDIMGSSAAYLVQQLDDALDNEQRLRVLESYLKNIFLSQTKRIERFNFRYQDIEQALDYTHQNIFSQEKPTTVKQIAKGIRISERHFRRKFEEVIGVPPQYYTKVFRFRYAMSLLKSFPQASMTDIAYQSGYFDVAHFSRDFKRFTGFAPSIFEKQETDFVKDYSGNLEV